MDNYKAAAVRHFRDAIALKEHKKLDNAGHLIGFSAECAIKHEISQLKNAGDIKLHFPELLQAARKKLHKRSGMHKLLRVDLLQGWNIDRRYHSDGNTILSEWDRWLKDTRQLLFQAGIRVTT